MQLVQTCSGSRVTQGLHSGNWWQRLSENAQSAAKSSVHTRFTFPTSAAGILVCLKAVEQPELAVSNQVRGGLPLCGA